MKVLRSRSQEHLPSDQLIRGLGPLLPLFDHLLTTLVSDLEQRGLLDDVLVLAMGEFGRTPLTNGHSNLDHTVRPRYIVENNGRPLAELMA